MAHRRSAATPLALAWAGLIAYASLYPGDWRALPPGGLAQALVLPWPRYWTAFDAVSNFLGYLPLGALLCLARLRGGGATLPGAAAAAALAGCALSLAMEELQNFLPERVPSRMDWALNSAGALAGAVLALAAHGWADHWQALRERWFVPHSAAALALLMLWPVGLLFPAPLPLALGQALARLPALAARALEGTPLQAWAAQYVPGLDATASWAGSLPPAAETLAIALGLLAPCLLAYSVAQRGWHRLWLPAGAAALGFAATTLSTALNFGPQHLLAWLTDAVVPAFVAGLIAAAALAAAPRRVAAGLGLVALAALVTLVTLAPADPYYAESLQGWEQGRFIRFHGVAQWIGWLWPYAAMVELLRRLAGSDAP